MTRRTALWLTGAAALVLGTVLLAIDDRMWDAGGPGIIGFELAGSEDRAGDILLEWGDEGQDAARLSLWLDFAYLVFYGAFLYLAAAATRDLARARGWARLAAIGRVAVPAAPAAAAFDAAEDIALLVVLGGDGGAAGPVIATAFAGLKFLMLTVVIVYVLAGLVRRAYARSPRAVWLAAVGTGVAVVVLLALNAWISGRETEAAEADPPGRVLELPGGDIHVREDGARGKPPLVLIHGFACSMRWWDAITPLLAREHRVIRIDLLGHGGSEKPRDGYSMENQADLVAAAMDRMGVARAAVVGHSMGGMVGTALVERHRERVSRLMTIGTPPDLDSAEPSASRRVAGLPVVGPAISRLAPQRMVHAEVESTFIPEFDPPDRAARRRGAHHVELVLGLGRGGGRLPRRPPARPQAGRRADPGDGGVRAARLRGRPRQLEALRDHPGRPHRAARGPRAQPAGGEPETHRRRDPLFRPLKPRSLRASPRSSVDQSERLLTARSQVRVLPGAFEWT